MARFVENVSVEFMSSARLQPDGMYESENFGFTIDPYKQCSMFNGSFWFEPHVAAAQFLWYLKGDRDDESIYEFMPIYRNTRNTSSPLHNSNYGYYFYKLGYLDSCVSILKNNVHSRRASFMINNNEVAFGPSIDKLCTNSVSFRIRNMALNMSVHMRSNDYLNMMPYDMFQFCMAYGMVFSKLKQVYKDLKIGKYYHSADSMHTDKASFVALKTFFFGRSYAMTIPDFANKNFSVSAERYFSHILNSYKSRQQ